jgi:hypothetical protein
VIRIKYVNDQISEPITTNQGVRQGCGLSPTMFTIYINKVIKGWKGGGTNGIQLRNRITIKIVIYADDQVLNASSEDELHMAAHRLNNIAKKHNLKISTQKQNQCEFVGMKSED